MILATRKLAEADQASYTNSMRKISAMDAQSRFGELLDAAQRAPVTVTRQGRPAAVILSVEEYERMRGAAWKRLAATMEAARREAAERGLTDERLDELLADES
jgi:prevent-host-death family protein